MLARCLHGIMPGLTHEERIEVSQIHSVVGLLDQGHLIQRRPFRAPHHTTTSVALIGGGNGFPRPGEVSLAHRGVLFLDEFVEFPRPVREVLRQPMESGAVTIARALLFRGFEG
jgi:magnesium chelatase family protein